jgi:hypothetical protein
MLQLFKEVKLMLSNYQQFLYGPVANFPVLMLVLVLLWSLAWKGLALWRSAKSEQKYWFIAFLVFNTLGVLPIIYFVFFQKKKKSK